MAKCLDKIKETDDWKKLSKSQKELLEQQLGGLDEDQVGDVINDFMIHEYKKTFNKMKNEGVKSEYRKGIEALKLGVDNIKDTWKFFRTKVNAVQSRIDKVVNDAQGLLHQTLEQRGILKLYGELKVDPDFLQKQFKISQQKFLQLVQDGERGFKNINSISLEVRTLARTLRDFLEKDFPKQMKSLNDSIGIRKNYGLPFSFDAHRINSVGFDRFYEEVSAHMTSFASQFSSPKQFDAFMKEWYSYLINPLDSSFKSNPKVKFLSRRISFDTLEGQYDVLTKYGFLENGVVNAIDHHVATMSRNVAIWDKLGDDPIGNMLGALTEVERKAAGNNTTGLLDKVQELQSKKVRANVKHSLNELLGSNQLGRTQISFISESVKHAVQLRYLGNLFIRELISDKPIAAAFNLNAMFGKNIMGSYMEYMTSLFKYVAVPAYKREIQDVLRTTAGMLEYSHGRALYDLGLSNFTTQTIKGQNKWERASIAVKGLLEKGSNKFFRVTGVEAIHNFSGGLHAYRIQSNISSILSRQNYTQLTPALRNSLAQAGIFEAEYKALQRVKRTRMESSGDEILGVEDVKNLSDEVIAIFARKDETFTAARARLDSTFRTFVADNVQKSSGTASFTDRLATSQHKPADTLQDAAFAQITRFLPAPITFWRNLTESVAAAQTGNPYKGGSPTAYSLFLAQRGVNLVMTGVLLTWATDLVQGKTPRAMTPDNLALAMLSSGVGGALGAIMSAMIITGGTETISPPALAMIEEVSRFVANPTKEKAGRLAKNYSGLGNMWYTHIATRKLIYEGLLNNNAFTRAERRFMRRNDQESFID